MAGALAGDITEAEHDEYTARRSNPSLDGVFGVDVARAEAWVLAARGELSAAARRGQAAAEVAAARRHHAFEAFALHDVARFAPSRVTADRLLELSKLVDGPLVDAIAAHARGLADDDGDRLDEAARGFSAMRLDLFAAEAGFAAARVHRRDGRRARAFAALELARAHACRCEDVRTPALTWADQPEDLTPREREIADLAAANLPSREIATRLGITTRTVDNLLGRVYAKLGISGRQALTDLLGERPQPDL